MLEIRLLGQFQISVDGALAEIASRPAQSLLAYLALHVGVPQRRERLAGLLWPDSDEANARRNLRQALWHGRRGLGATAVNHLLADDIHITFAATSPFWLDTAVLEQRRGGETAPVELMTDVAAYGGELLPGFYDDWVVLERERLEAVFDRKMRQLLDQLVVAHQWEAVLEWGERWIALGHTPEPAYRALMVAHSGRGDLSQVAAVYRRCAESLARDLGVDPSEQTRALYERLARGDKVIATGGTAAFRERYRLVDELGRGGLGVVYRAQDALLDRPVAIKLLSSGPLDSEGRARLLREAQSAARLNHTNIVTIYDAGEATLSNDSQPDPFIVMELIEGQSLAHYRPANLMATLHIARQICLALEHAHAHSIIHRDLKPENILITPEGTAKLMDFGLAHSLAAPRLTEMGTILGTPAYIAPEIIRGETADGRCDLYALGIILYEYTTGHPPFDGESLTAVFAQHLHATPTPPQQRNATIPVELNALILQLLQKHPADRPVTASAVRQVLDQLLGQTVDTENAPAPGLPPYKGLLPFMEADADHFFGRETLVAQLLLRLDQAPFLAVVGASGSGKSSLVRAGLVPALQQQGATAVVIITPTAHPLESLALALTQTSESVTAAATLMDDLAHEPRSLRLFMRRQPTGERYLIVDQFEELFTLCRSEAERQPFIANLLHASAVCSLIITLRADFYAHCAGYDQLRQALAQHQEYIGPMNIEELRRAITEPARQGGWQFEPGLVDLFLRDVGAAGGQSPEPGALPLLSHALLEAWQRRRGQTLTLAGYAEAGGVHGAIARTAERVYQQLTPEAQKMVRNLFLRLTEPGEGTQDTRRRATLAELAARPDDVALVTAVGASGWLQTLVQARLITTAENSIEVAHEALIREWPRLRSWLNEDREGLRLHRHLTEAAQAWEALGREPGELYRGARLAQTAEWAAAHDDQLNQQEREFLAAAQARMRQREAEVEAQRQRELVAAQKLAEAEAQRAQEQAQAAQRLRRRAIFLSGALLVAALLALTAVVLGQRAQLAARNARARELAAAAINSLDTDAELAGLLALQAVATTYDADGMALREAENALHQVLPSLRIRRRFQSHTASVNDFALSPDGTQLVTVSNDMTAKLWAVATGEEMATLAGHTDWVWDVDYSANGRFIATAGRDATVRVWDVSTQGGATQGGATLRGDNGRLLLTLTGDESEMFYVDFSPDDQWLAAGDGQGIYRLWQLHQQGDGLAADLQVTFVDTGGFGPLAFSPDGRSLALHANEEAGGEIWVWRLADVVGQPRISGSQGAQILCCQPEMTLLTYSSEGLLVSSSNNATTKLWDATTGQERLTLYGHAGPVNGVAFSPDGQRLVTSSGDGSTKIWQLAPGSTGAQLLLTLPGQIGPVIESFFLPDGQSLVSASEGGTVTVWDITPGREVATLAGHEDWVWAADVSRDGTMVATAGFGSTQRGATAVVWDLATGQELLPHAIMTHTDWINRVAFSPNGRLLATASNDASIKLWEIATGQEQATLTGHAYVDDSFPYNGVGHVLFTADGQYLFSSGGDGTVRLWEVATGQELWQLAAHDQVITFLGLSADGTRLATVGFDARAHIWALSGTAKPTLPLVTIELPGQERGTWGAAFTPDGTRLAITERDGKVSVWDVAEGSELLYTLTGHTSIVPGAAFSPDGRRLATASFDLTTKVWDMATGSELLTLTGHSGGVTGVTFTPDGTRLITTSQDGTARIYVLALADLIALAQSRLTRSLSLSECQRFLYQPICP